MQLQEQNSAKLIRKEKRAAKADLKPETKRAAKASKAEQLEDLLLKAMTSGKQSERKRSRAHAAIADSDDDDNVSVFDRIRGKGAPKSLKAARRDKQTNAQSIADLLDTDDDCSE